MANGQDAGFVGIPSPLKRPELNEFTNEQISQFTPIGQPTTEIITQVPEPEVNEVPTPQDNVSSEISALRAIGQTWDAQLIENNLQDIGVKDSWIQAPTETPSLLGDAKDFITNFNLVPEESEVDKTMWSKLWDTVSRFNYGDIWYELKKLDKDTRGDFFGWRDDDNINNIFDFDELPPALQHIENNPTLSQKERLLENDQFRDALRRADPRSKFIYADVESTANIAFQIDQLEQQLANWLIRSTEEFETKAMDAFRIGYQEMWWGNTNIREDFTIDEASAFLEENLKKIDYVASKRPNDFKPIMQRFSEGAEQFKLKQNSTFQQYLDNQHAQQDVTMDLMSDMEWTISANMSETWKFPGWVSADDVSLATNKIIQNNERNVQSIFDFELGLNEYVWENKKYLPAAIYESTAKDLDILREKYTEPLVRAQAEVAALQFNFLISENLSPKEARLKVNEYYQDRWFTRGVESYLNEKIKINIEDFETFTSFDTHGIHSDENTIDTLKTPYQRYSTIINTIKQDVAQQVKNETAWSKFLNFYNRSVTSLQINFWAPVASILKTPTRSFQKGEFQDDYLDEDTIDNMSEFMKDTYFTKTSSFASSDLGGVWVIDVDPSKKSKFSNTVETLTDMWPDFAIAFWSMYVWAKWIGAVNKITRALSATKSNRLLRSFNLERLTQLATIPTADVIISAGIQESIWGIYRDMDVKIDLMMLSVFDLLPVLTKSIGDIKFLNMDSKVGNSILKWNKITIDELDQAKRVYTDMNNALYNVVRKDPKRANVQLKKSYVRAKISDFVVKWPTSPQDVADIQAMVRQMDDPNQNILDMLKFDRVDYIDQKTWRSLSGGMSLGPYTAYGSRAVPSEDIIKTIIPDNIRASGIKSIDQKFTVKQAERVAESLWKSVDEVFAKQSNNAFLIKDPKSLGIQDKRSLSNQIQSNIGRQLLEWDKKVADAFYDAVASKPEFGSKWLNMKSAGVYEQMFSSMKNLLC